MENSNILGTDALALEADAAQNSSKLRSITAVFCVLLLTVLLFDPAFTRFADHFLDYLLVPVRETGNASFQKSSAGIPDMENTAKPALKELNPQALKASDPQAFDLKNPAPAIPDPDKASLLTETPIPDKNLMLKDLLAPGDENLFPAGESEASATDIDVADTDINAADTDIKFVDSALPETASETPLDVPAISEISAAVSGLHDPLLPDQPLDADIQQDPETPASDATQVSAKEDIVHNPALQDTLPDDPQSPKENIVDSTILDGPVTPPAEAEVIEPDPDVSDTSPSDITPSDTAPSDASSSDAAPTEDASSDVAPTEDASSDAVPSDMETGSDDANTAETTSCFLLDESGMLCKFLPEYAEISDGCLFLPPECTGIRSGAFSGTGDEITELYIPSGAVMLEAGALNGLNSLLWIETDGPNPVYTSINGVLFDSTASTLITFPAGRTDAYSLPSHVTQIAGGAFADTSLRRLDLRRCSVLFLDGNIFGVSGGNGIVIAVPAEDFSAYEEMLGGCAVTLTI